MFFVFRIDPYPEGRNVPDDIKPLESLFQWWEGNYTHAEFELRFEDDTLYCYVNFEKLPVKILRDSNSGKANGFELNINFDDMKDKSVKKTFTLYPTS